MSSDRGGAGCPLRLADLPPPGEDGLNRFVSSFNGYEHFGSFAASAEAALSRRRTTVEDLRNELFFRARAERHAGVDDSSIPALYAELYPLFVALLTTPGEDREHSH